MSAVPAVRLRARNEHAVRPAGRFVLYWMIAARRTGWNYGLQRAAELARELGRPLVVLEALRLDYPWASARHHRFVLDGMAANAAALADEDVLYHPWVELERGAGRGFVEALAREACAVVTDEAPGFFQERMLRAVAPRLAARLESVDSCGLLPLAATERVFARAVDLRRFLQRNLRPHLAAPPLADPLAAPLPPVRGLALEPLRRWPRAAPELLARGGDALARLDLDHAVEPVDLVGGQDAARAALRDFVAGRLAAYGEERSHPDRDVSSGLSPWLHFGHVSAHEVLAAVTAPEGWTPARTGGTTSGAKAGWWGLAPSTEAFLDELVTWRELGQHFCAKRDDYDRYESLPPWARETLEEHAADPRPHVYTAADFEAARTHDELWNAAQRELVQSGRMHNYLRMLWGKKILHWSASPREALATMIELNNKYALDGRDPNSYSGIAWVLGRFDRAWGPERAIFGKVRYMSSDNTRRKLRLNEYLATWGAAQRTLGF
ncbi:MAG: deoxyribodipyrimidine photolyase [Planctomycetes bacterium]|nr:deoxyribodipyrimidine photolyase [Planctomycetota bacterium]